MNLSPVQIQILSILFEAGEENMPTLLNTIWSNSKQIDKEGFIEEVLTDLQAMNDLNLTNYAYLKAFPEPQWEPLTKEELLKVLPLQNCLGWNDETNSWFWKEETCGKERVSVVIEDAGQQFISAHLSLS